MKKVLQWNLVLILLSLVACRNSNEFFRENKAALEGYQKSPSGFYYKFYVHGDGDSVRINDDVYGTYWKAWCDSVVEQALTDFEILGTALLRNSFTEIFLMLRVGDSVSFVFPSEMLPNKNDHKPPYFHLCNRIKLTMHIKATKPNVEAIRNDFFIQNYIDTERKRLADYALRHNISVLPNSDGVYVVVKEKGKGKVISIGDVVSFQAVSYSLEHPTDLLTSWNELEAPTVYQLKIGQKAWFSGVDQALVGQTKGSKLRLIMPAGAVQELPDKNFEMHLNTNTISPIVLDIYVWDE